MDYREEQTGSGKLAAALLITMLTALAGGMVMSMVQIKQQGGTVYYMLIGMTAGLLLAGWIYYVLFLVKLETEADASGFSYRYFPFIRKKKLIPWDDLISWKVAQRSTWMEKLAFGFKRSVFRKQIRIVLSGSHMLVIKWKNGNTFMCSTDNAYALTLALRKYSAERELK